MGRRQFAQAAIAAAIFDTEAKAADDLGIDISLS